MPSLTLSKLHFIFANFVLENQAYSFTFVILLIRIPNYSGSPFLSLFLVVFFTLQILHSLPTQKASVSINHPIQFPKGLKHLPQQFCWCYEPITTMQSAIFIPLLPTEGGDGGQSTILTAGRTGSSSSIPSTFSILGLNITEVDFVFNPVRVSKIKDQLSSEVDVND